MKNLVLLLLALFGLSACAAPNYGTGIKFTPAINPEPDKYALVYAYRSDGWGYGGKAKNPLVINVIYENDPDFKVPVGIYQAQQYRPFLFEAPKKLKFGATVSVKQDMDLKPGETYCIEVGWHFRVLDVVTYNERPLDECMKDLADMELVKSLDEIRRINGAAPFKQIGFKELIPAPSLAKQVPILVPEEQK